jgi:hypothetical protein
MRYLRALVDLHCGTQHFVGGYAADFHAQQNRYFVSFSAPTFFAACKYLVSSGWVNAVFPSERLNRFTLMFKPSLGLCSGAYSGHSSKPFKLV